MERGCSHTKIYELFDQASHQSSSRIFGALASGAPYRRFKRFPAGFVCCLMATLCTSHESLKYLGVDTLECQRRPCFDREDTFGYKVHHLVYMRYFGVSCYLERSRIEAGVQNRRAQRDLHYRVNQCTLFCAQYFQQCSLTRVWSCVKQTID